MLVSPGTLAAVDVYVWLTYFQTGKKLIKRTHDMRLERRGCWILESDHFTFYRVWYIEPLRLYNAVGN